MIVSRDIVHDMLRNNKIAGVIDQNLGMAKYIVCRQIQRPASEMIAFYTLTGDVAVTPKPKENKLLTIEKEKDMKEP